MIPVVAPCRLGRGAKVASGERGRVAFGLLDRSKCAARSTRSLAPYGTSGSTTRWFDGSGGCVLAKLLEAGRPGDFTELEDAAGDDALLDLERAAVPRAGRESSRRGSTADSLALSFL